ncbi:unnamed protein product [Caenorhabditis angaria]|uniref:Tyrosine-protein kinase n=1 Tax=Caenorhabditis angaria TaxID=860376 RepID=A0A9P1INE1_9PELO|nr:unnamed protein product [Caenorhabditis angaria]
MSSKMPETPEKSWLAEKLNVKKLQFYHGVVTREDVQNNLRDCQIGDFCLRSALMKTETVLRIFLCVKIGEQEIVHYLLDFKDEKFVVKQEIEKEGKGKIVLDSPVFKDYDDMIQYYRHHRLACGIRLRASIPRPKYQLNPAKIFYDKEAGKLGEGNFCFVYRGKLRRSNGREEEIAVKVSKATDHNVDSASIMATRNELFAEAKLLTAIRHPHIIKLYGTCCDSPPFLVVMEFCTGGSVENLVKNMGKDMEEYEKQTILIDACRGIRYLHEKKCVHRDLAARNCLISADGLIKVADFGLSRALLENQTAFKEALKEAPLAWLAPECIQKESEFSTKSDVWAFGVLCYEVYFDGRKPFEDEKDTGIVIRNIRKANMPTIGVQSITPKMDEMLNGIWTKKPEDRIDIQQCLEFLVEALVPGNLATIKRMQLNKLAGVLRKKMANTDTDREETEMPCLLNKSSSVDTRVKLLRKKSSTTAKRRAKLEKKKSTTAVEAFLKSDE